MASWDLGDWLVSGEKHLSAAYDEAEEITGLARGSLYNIASLARQFPISRRHENLSFYHYAKVAALEDESQQDRLLKYGSKNELSVREMHAAVQHEIKVATGQMGRERGRKESTR